MYNKDVDTFDELRFIVYHEKYVQFDIERFPPTSEKVFLENIDLDPLEYGYRLTEDNNLVPIISTKQSIPSNFPQACNCKKCSKASVYKCRLLEIRCCQFCKCDESPVKRYQKSTELN